MKQEKWSQLLHLYNKSIAEKPNKVEPYLQRGHFYFQNNEIELAIADYSLAIDLNPSCFESYNSRALAYFKKELFQQALYDFNSALKINPSFPLLYVNRGMAYTQSQQHIQAISDYNQAINLWLKHFKYPQNLQRWRAYHNRAITQRYLKNDKQCLLDMLRTMILVPQQRKVHAAIAQLYKELPHEICQSCLGEKFDAATFKHLELLHKQFSAEKGRRKEIFQEILFFYVQSGKSTLIASLRSYQRRYFKD